MPNLGSFLSKEAELNNYFQNSVSYLTTPANGTRLGVSAALNSGIGDWTTYYPITTDPNSRTKTAVDQKMRQKRP